MATISQALALALAHHQAGRLPLAEEIYRRVLHVEPEAAEVWLDLGLALEGQGKRDEAAACYTQAAELKPDLAEAHYDLGNLLRARGQPDMAVERFRRALEVKPELAEAHVACGNALLDLGKSDEAADAYRHALALRPDYAQAHNNLGAALQNLGQLDEAIASYRRAIQHKPDYAESYNNLGNALQSQACLDEAIECYRHAVALRPELPYLHSNLVYSLHFSPHGDAAAIAEEAERWNRRHAEPLAREIAPHANPPSPDRRLRVGYVSPDLRTHPVGRFLLPLLESHDHQNFEIFCYSSVRIADSVTERLRSQADVWRDASLASDEQLAQGIREDRIDILVDLTMHMLGNRLLTFARRPAPVQVCYLAYCGTTGLRTIDYRLTDPYLDPHGRDEQFYSEWSVALPETYWCYRPVTETPEVAPPPVMNGGQLTFGCLNNFSKVSGPALAVWAELLQRVPKSRLLLHAHAGSHRQRVAESLASKGIAPDRLEFVGLKSTAEYFDLYGRIDVALDPFPYGGGTTTCDALWMGVPVVSLAGRTAVGRGGLSILSNVGLADLVAGDAEQYVRIAAALAGERERLAAIRPLLRDRMRRSPLMDAPRLAKNVEAAYRAMWQRWCAKQ